MAKKQKIICLVLLKIILELPSLLDIIIETSFKKNMSKYLICSCEWRTENISALAGQETMWLEAYE